MSWSDKLLTEYKIRKSKKQKEKFISYIKENIDGVVIEEGGKLVKSKNILFGNTENPEYILTAHYDTCAFSPIPNVMFPTSKLMYWLYQIVILGYLVLAMAIVMFIMLLFTDNAELILNVSSATMYIILIQMMFGFQNPNTANDNTSGVLTVIHIYETLPEDLRGKCLFVLFDNEEKGLFGSAAFKKKDKERAKKFLINFDCVGDGDNIFLGYTGKVECVSELELLKNSAPEDEKKRFVSKKIGSLYFSSDQMRFKNGVAFAALRGKYLLRAARIHTPFDTKCDKENIKYLSKLVENFLKNTNTITDKPVI